MARLNDNYLKLAAGYLFPEIARRMDAFKQANPKADVIKLGIGDVVLPLAGAVRQAMHDAIDEMAMLRKRSLVPIAARCCRSCSTFCRTR